MPHPAGQPALVRRVRRGEHPAAPLSQVVNAGKSQTIEDQAVACHSRLSKGGRSLQYTGGRRPQPSGPSVRAV